MNGYMLPEYDARQLADEKETAAYYDAVVAAFPEGAKFHKQAANWLLGPVRFWLNEHGGNMSAFPVTPEKMVALIELVEAGKVNFSIAQQEILPEMIVSAEKIPMDIAVVKNLIQEGDADTLKIWVEEVMAEMPDKVNEFRKGKKGLIGLFVGEVKKKSKGKADPKRTNDILLEYLNNK